MTPPPVTAVDDHRKKPVSTTTRPPTPKNRCKIVTKSGQKKNDRPLSPDFSAIPAIPAIFPPKHVPPFHLPHNSCSSLVRPRMPPNPTTPTPKKRRPHYLDRLNPTLTRHIPTQPDITRPPHPTASQQPSVRHPSQQWKTIAEHLPEPKTDPRHPKTDAKA